MLSSNKNLKESKQSDLKDIKQEFLEKLVDSLDWGQDDLEDNGLYDYAYNIWVDSDIFIPEWWCEMEGYDLDNISDEGVEYFFNDVIWKEPFISKMKKEVIKVYPSLKNIAEDVDLNKFYKKTDRNNIITEALDILNKNKWCLKESDGEEANLEDVKKEFLEKLVDSLQGDLAIVDLKEMGLHDYAQFVWMDEEIDTPLPAALEKKYGSSDVFFDKVLWKKPFKEEIKKELIKQYPNWGLLKKILRLKAPSNSVYEVQFRRYPDEERYEQFYTKEDALQFAKKIENVYDEVYVDELKPYGNGTTLSTTIYYKK